MGTIEIRIDYWDELHKLGRGDTEGGLVPDVAPPGAELDAQDSAHPAAAGSVSSAPGQPGAGVTR